MAGKNYAHQLDDKNRMRIPAKLREGLGESYVVTIGTGGCLYVYTAEQFKGVKELLSKVNPYREDQLKAARMILYNTWVAEEDKQGRILLPDNLRKFAKLEKNIVVFQGTSCVEIWSEEVWNKYFEDVSFEAIANAYDELKKL